MRKILLTIGVLLTAMNAPAQVVSYGTADGAYVEIVSSGLDKSHLWSNLKRWASVTFVSYKHTVDMEDKESGSMVMKFSVTDDRAGTYTATTTSAVLQVDVKDKKYRIKVSDPIFEVRPNSECSGDMSWMPSSILEKARTEMKAALNLSNEGIGSYEALKKAIGIYTMLRDRTPKYNKPKDEKKGKVNPTYELYDKTVGLASWIRMGYSREQEKIAESLKKGMAYTDDF